MFSQVSGCDGTAKSLSKRRRKVAEEVMSNEDLLLEVLLRLPAKPLTRFKCVSKQWLSLISDPKFGSKHTRLNPSLLTLGIYFNDKYNYRFQSVSLDQAHQKNLPSLAFINMGWSSFCSDRPKIMHACNGLILYSYRGKIPYYVCNMTTRKTTVLPQHPLPSFKWYPNDYCAYLVTDPSKSPHFKVVLLNMTVFRHDTNFHYDDQYREKAAYCYGLCYEIDVYSSENGVWKRLFFRALHGSPLNFKAVCDGSLHWITKEKFHVRFEVDTLKLVSNPMPSKPKTIDVEKIRYFGECCGHLFLIHIPWRSAKPFHVYELDKDHSIWKMKYNVNLSLLMTAYPDSFQYLEPTKRRRLPTFGWKFFIVCLVKEDDINGFSVMLAIPGKIVSYNLTKNTCKVLQEWPLKEFPLINQYYFTETFPFVSTLFPV